MFSQIAFTEGVLTDKPDITKAYVEAIQVFNKFTWSSELLMQKFLNI